MAATYTVKKGDTLSEIAQTYLSTIRNAAGNSSLGVYNPNGGATKKLADWNGISNQNYIVVGQVIKLEPGSGSSNSNVQTTKPVIKVFGILSTDGSSRSIYCSWNWNKERTSGYELYWQEYRTVGGTDQWIYTSGNNPATVSGSQNKQHIYTASSDAKKVRLQLRAKSETYTNNNNTVPYWTYGESGYSVLSDSIEYDFSDNNPLIPSTPSVSITNYVLTAELYNIDQNINATHIEFQIVKNDLTAVGTCQSEITFNHASITYNIAGGNSYGVRCRSVRGNKKSEWTTFVYASSKPGGTPEITTCKAESETSVRLEWTAVESATSANDPIEYEIEYITDRTHFDITGEASGLSGLDTLTYIITGLTSGDEYFFRIRATNNQGYGDWSEIKSVTIGTKPTSPTTWSSTTVASPSQNVNLYWAHNTVDGSTQQYAQIKITVGNSSNTYTINTSNTASAFSSSTTYSLNNYVKYNNEIYRYKLTFPSSGVWDESKWEATKGIYTLVTAGYSSGAKVTWSIRTAGVKKDTNGNYEYGDWSIDRTIDIYAQPTLAISIVDYQNRTVIDNSPIDEITTFPFYISAEASPNSQNPISYHVAILSEETYQTVDNVGNIKTIAKGEEVYSKNFDVTTFSLLNNVWKNLIEFSAGNVSLENNISYTVTCTVGMDSGLTAQASLSFSVSWSNVLYKPNAVVTINTDESITTYIRPYCKDTNENLVNNVTLSVYRREFDGSFTELISGVTNNGYTNVTDPHPSLDYARYRIVAKSTTSGAVSYLDLPGYYIGEKAVIIQWNEKWSNFDVLNPQDATPTEEPSWAGSILKLPYNIDISDSYNPDISLIEYVGRKNPVSYYGTHLGEKSTWNVEIDKEDKNTLYALRRLAIWMGDVYVREPSGSGYWANINVAFSQKHCELTIPVTLSMTRVEGGI